MLQKFIRLLTTLDPLAPVDLFLDQIFPRSCYQCAVNLDMDELGVCGSCWMQVRGLTGKYCSICGSPRDLKRSNFQNHCKSCRNGSNLFVQAACIGFFEPPLNEMIHYLKYIEGRLYWKKRQASFAGRFFARRMAQIFPSRRRIAQTTVIMPVPLHPSKLKKRGYNQSELLAAPLSEYVSIPMDTTSLIRVIDTVSQTTLDAKSRRENVENAFKVVDPDRIKGEKVLLIDDVLTTGSTINGCASKLLDNGVDQVCVMTIARAKGGNNKIDEYPQNDG
ncbi:MAG: hypothetical protein B6244_01590 [Candidatus Cloacimonetes bacterium 4572_55]|nr:MAG: hypothetical protein B6244_01590 [Candidatus Cloacimonetes bacterium 4572_55]